MRIFFTFIVVLIALTCKAAEYYELWLGESVEIQCPIPNHRVSNSVVSTQNFSWSAPEGIDYQMGNGVRIAKLTISKFFLDTRTVTCTVTWTESTHTSFSTTTHGPYTQVYRFSFSFPKVKATPNQTTYTLTVGSSQEIGYSLTNQPSNPSTSVYFKTTDPNIATINNSGVLTAVNPGECEVILGTNYEEETSAHVVVNGMPITAIDLNQNDINLSVNETFQLVPQITPSNALSTGINYISNNPTIAEVDNNGLITAISKGKTFIKVESDNGISTTCNVIVNSLIPEAITLPTYNINLNLGDKYVFDPLVSPVGAEISYFLYLIDDPKIAMISDSGELTTLKTGSTIVHISGGGLNTQALVTVRDTSVKKTLIHHHSVLSVNGVPTIVPICDLLSSSIDGEKTLEIISHDDSWNLYISENDEYYPSDTNISYSDFEDKELNVFHQYNFDLISKDISTGISDIIEDLFEIKYLDNQLIISDIKNVEYIRIYELNGILLTELDNSSNYYAINLQKNKIYILEYATNSKKQALKLTL